MISDIVCLFRRTGIVLLLFGCGLLHAQQVYPVQVTSMPAMFSAATVYLGDFAHIEATAGRLNFMIQLKDPVEQSRQVHFRLHVERRGTTVMMTDPSILPPLLTLMKDQPIMINGTDLAFYFDLNHLVGTSGFELSNVLPEDYYSICIEVIDYLRQIPISDKICVSGFLNQLSPPLLYMPQPGASLSPGQMNSLMFHWQLTGISLLFQSNIRYDFQLRELVPGLDNFQDAFDSHTLIFDQPDNYSYSLIYGASMPPLVKGKTYIWRVRAYARDYNGMEIPGYFRNNGFSEVWRFTVPADENPIEESCNPRTPKPVQNRVPLRQLSVSDVIQVGHFAMTITRWEQTTGEGFSGEGVISIPFLDIDVDATFDNLTVNERKEAFTGQVKVKQADVLRSKLQGNADGTIDFASEIPFTDADAGEVMAILERNSSSPLVSLPYSLKDPLKLLFNAEMPYELIVSDMWFAPGGAKFNAIMLVPDGLGGYARFGASNIDMDHAGLDFKDLHLFLAENARMPGYDDIPVQILANGSDATLDKGSFAAYTCEGFETFNLQGRYVFAEDRLVRASNASLPADATFKINTPVWGEFMAEATIPDFAIKGMDGWRFHVVTAVADFTTEESKAHEDLIGDDYDKDKIWKGFYIKDLTLTLPQELRFESERALRMATKNLTIDSTGANGSLKGHRLLDLETGLAGGWGLSFEEMQVNIVRDTFLEAAIKGKIIAAPLGDTITYDGNIFIDQGTKQYAIDMIPLGSIVLPYLNGGFDFKNGSLVSIRQDASFCASAWTPYADLNVDFNMTMQEADFAKMGGPDMSGIMAQVKAGLAAPNEFTFAVTNMNIDGFKINHPGLPAGKQFGFDDTSLSDGSITMAGVHMSLGGFDLLEEELDLDGIKKGLGMGYHLSYGSYGVISKFWALDNGADASMPFSLALIELDFPKVIKVPFQCICKTPEAGSGLPDYCQPPVSPEGSSALEVGSIVKIGHFSMEVVTLSGKTGKGKIPVPFLGYEMMVDFKDLQLDPHGMMTAGVVQSEIGSLFADFEQMALQEQTGQLNVKGINDPAAFLKLVKMHMEEMGEELKCPVSMKGLVHNLIPTLPIGDFEFLLMGIHFGADSARLNGLVIFETLEGDYLKFGIAGIVLRPDGFNLNGLNLFLDEEVSITADYNTKMKFLVSKERDPESGSFIRYDCDGFKEFALRAIYPFKNNLLVQSSNSLFATEALLTMATPTWGNFMASVHIPSFSIPDLEGWTFEVLEASADFSTERNLEEIVFPSKYQTTGVDWQGIYVKSLKVTLPEDLILGNSDVIEMVTESLIIDQQGVTGHLIGSDLISSADTNVRGGLVSLKELELNLQRNHFVSAYINGDALFAPWITPMLYEGVIYKEQVSKEAPNSFYAIDIVPLADYSSDVLKINYTDGEGSGITFRKRPVLDENGQPVLVDSLPVYTYEQDEYYYAQVALDIPSKAVSRMLRGVGLSTMSGAAHLLGLENVGYRNNLIIKNIHIHHGDLRAALNYEVERYKLATRLYSSGHQPK